MSEYFRNPIVLAACGGLLGKLIDLVELHAVPKNRRPDLKEFLYWLQFVIWPAAGGILALAYQESGHAVRGLLALNIGLSAPLIVKSMMSAAAPLRNNVINTGEGA